jgi:hypothetical protein
MNEMETNYNYRNSLKPNLTFVRLEKWYYATTAVTRVGRWLLGSRILNHIEGEDQLEGPEEDG